MTAITTNPPTARNTATARAPIERIALDVKPVLEDLRERSTGREVSAEDLRAAFRNCVLFLESTAEVFDPNAVTTTDWVARGPIGQVWPTLERTKQVELRDALWEVLQEGQRDKWAVLQLPGREASLGDMQKLLSDNGIAIPDALLGSGRFYSIKVKRAFDGILSVLA